MSLTDEERAWHYVDKNGPTVREGLGPCWPWTGTIGHGGYGRIAIGGLDYRAHRVVWRLVHGEPGDLNVLHHCDNPPCCNPDHLFLGTDLDNAADRDAKERQARGEESGTAKLTESGVREIRAAFAAGMTQSALGPFHGVSQTTSIRYRTQAP